CTKPLGRNGDEAAEILRLVTDARAFHGYLDNEVFSPDVIRVQALVGSGALGRVLTMRAREGHSGPHAAHFWDAETAGGGALLDMASPGAEAARFVCGTGPVAQDVLA